MKKVSHIQLLALAAPLLVLICYYWQPGLFESFEARTYDLRMKLVRGSLTPSSQIAIIAIDDKSISEFGQFPWPRHRFSQLLDVTSKAGSRAVLFDIIFPEEQNRANDLAFARSIGKSGSTILAQAFEFSDDGSATGVKANIPVLQSAARSIAHINIFPDDDGIIRWGRLLVPYHDSRVPSLGMSGAAALLETREITVAPDGVMVGPRKIPTDTDQRMLINYRGTAGSYQRFSFADVAMGRIAPEMLRDKVLLVGATAIALYDMRITPVSNNMPGVEVNANIADNIATGDFIRRGTPEALLDIVFIAVFGLTSVFVTLKLRHSVSLPTAILLICGYTGVSTLLFLTGSWVSVVYPVFSIILSFTVTAYLRFFFLDRTARDIRAMFSCYVSRKVVDELVKNPELAKVGGEEREITILFADVKNYTSYSEKRTPAEVVRILNEYLAEMTDIILAHEGTLDKFLGDGILAYWNAPLHQENHAELAVQCAHAMMNRMGPLQERWLQHGDEPISWGIGINTGKVIVGTIGAQGKKMEYTAIGDNVNLTYRIQNESRDKECPIITRALYERVKHLVEVEPIGEVVVKGKQVPIEIFALREVAANARVGEASAAA